VRHAGAASTNCCRRTPRRYLKAHGKWSFGPKRKHFREEPGVRDIETIDAELRRLVRAWRVARVVSDRIPSTELIDELLDERAQRLNSSSR
jgi:hypothetical protein